MAFTTGTATDQNDLLNQLHAWMTGTLGWTEHVWVPSSGPESNATLIISAPGAGPSRRVYCYLESYHNAVSQHFALRFRQAIEYDSLKTVGQQAGIAPYQVYFNLWNAPIQYWFYGNDRRVIVVARCGTVYVSMYMGLFLPFALPEQYPFPIVFAGDYYNPCQMSDTWTIRRMITDPGANSHGTSNLYVRTPEGNWLAGRNQTTPSNSTATDNWVNSGLSNSYAFLWPMSFGETWSGTPGYGEIINWWENLIPTRQDERPLWPALICPNVGSVLGALDGVYAMPGAGLVPEQAFSIGGRNFRVFQNIYRNSGNDFFAVEEA